LAKFTTGVPVVQRDPIVQVDATGADALPPGQHRFQLVVVDDSGNESAPVTINIIVVDRQKPTAVLDVTADAAGAQRIGDMRVAQGSAFFLSGSRSSDVGGKIVEYRFTKVPLS
jgi:hypothetical protein